MAIITPEVFADAVNAALGVKLRAGRLATDYTNLDDITQYGDTYHFPTFDRIGAASVVTKGTPIVPNNVSMTDSAAQIKQVGNAVRIFDKDQIQVKGNMKDRMAQQLGETLAQAVDADLINEIISNATYKDSTLTSLAQSDIIHAFDVFGDDRDNDSFAGILVNARLCADLLGMDAFTSATKTYAANGNGVVKDGVIGYWFGTIPVICTDNGTYNSTSGKAMLAIVKKEALGVIWQKAPTVEEEREAKLLATDLVAQELYATKLLRADGVSVLEVSANP